MLARSAALALFCAAFFVAAPHALATPPTRAQVRELLSGYEQVPPAATWEALGPETLGVLVALYDDASEPRHVRLRAVAVARHYPGEAARTFLRAVASASGQPDVFVREALLSLGDAFGPTAVPDVTPYLAHRSAVVRDGAVLALSRIGTRDALDALRARLAEEPARHVRAHIARALAP